MGAINVINGSKDVKDVTSTEVFPSAASNL